MTHSTTYNIELHDDVSVNVTVTNGEMRINAVVLGVIGHTLGDEITSDVKRSLREQIHERIPLVRIVA